ncbi:hypothetical protein DYB31_008122 [Aphanomyces astaci]|uniref:Condensin complex subunit 2 n=1 Tax=Aphanomyces astaci TaxID=112090 RepID=A0A397EF76_APHAT|nr:hypothetical protein DYB31_008122 [Aphanomyces astaci]
MTAYHLKPQWRSARRCEDMLARCMKKKGLTMSTTSYPRVSHRNGSHDDEPADSAAATDTYNFQKASCTLDASVKIYSYRVDDTWNSSFKVLENLTRGDERTPHAPFSIMNLPLNEST